MSEFKMLINSSILFCLLFVDQSLTPTPTAEKDESPFFYSQKTSNSLVSNEESKLSINSDDEKKSVTFQENSTPIKERKELVFHDRGFGKDSDSFSWDIPIYCYDCPMSALVTIPAAESDTEGASEEKREDIFQDFTQFAAHVFVDPFSLDEVPRSLEGRTKGRFGPSKDLLLHCSAVHDLFFRSFVTSTFSSLQHGQQVSMLDVHSAVEACEENFLEVDITEFIHTLCGHYIKSNKSKEAFFETTINEDLLSVPIWLPSESSEKRVRDLKESLVGQCESVDGLHKSITAKFFSIMGRYFKAVPPSREYFFYCPQQSEGPRKVQCDHFPPCTFVTRRITCFPLFFQPFSLLLSRSPTSKQTKLPRTMLWTETATWNRMPLMMLTSFWTMEQFNRMRYRICLTLKVKRVISNLREMLMLDRR